MAGFLAVSALPDRLSDPPKYDLVFSTNDYPSTPVPITVRLIVTDRALGAQYTRPSGQQGPFGVWKKLFIYEASPRRVRQLTFGFPADMTTLDGTREEPVASAAGLQLDTTLPGILVMLREYGRGGEAEHAVLAFTSIVFWAITVVVALDLLDANMSMTGVALGASLLCIGWTLDRSPHRAIAGLVYFFGAALLLEETYAWLRREPAEILFLGAACGVVVLAAVARSRSLLVVGTAALVGYTADFIYRHFADNLGAPLALMVIGLVLLAAGAAAVRLNAQYIAQKPARSASRP